MNLPTIQQLTDDQLYTLLNEIMMNSYMWSSNTSQHTTFQNKMEDIGESINATQTLSKSERDLFEEYADDAYCTMGEDDFNFWLKEVVGDDSMDDEYDYHVALKDAFPEDY